LEGRGRRLADADLFIAAIALAHGARLVTGNRRHYERIAELEIEDWMRDGDDAPG
jgi:predicted nucleic acid-binding protein